MLTLNDGRSELWQWDTGRTLAVDADCSQVHFSNKFFGRSIDVDVVEGTAIIPDILLQTDKDLNVWAFVGTAENGYTKISKTFKVNRRNKPADYVFTPTEQTTIAEIAAIAQSVRDDADAGLFGGVQPDWNQNDSTASDYVKNRPFYTGDHAETVLVEESTATFADEGGVYGAEVISTFLATVGETYKVSWDGTVYESVCADYRAGLFAIGNLSIAGAGADTGEPFIIVPNGSSIFIYTPDTSDTHTFSISGLATEVVKIPDKYVSDTFRDIVTAGDPLQWSKDDWAAYYGLFQGGKLLKIKAPGGSMIESYVLSMFYNAGAGTTQITTITTEGRLYYLSKNPYTNECYWSPVFEYGNLYLRYIQTGSNITPVNREEYDRLDVSGSLKFTTKKANEDEFSRKVVLEGDKEIVLSSYTANSTKKFKITVDDSGTMSATEVI